MQTNVVSIGRGDRAGVLASRNALVEAHMGLVAPIAASIARSLPPSFEVDDLVGTGFLGLISAATRYRPHDHNDTPFEVYARKVIRGAILDSVRRRRYLENTRVSIEQTKPARGYDPEIVYEVTKFTGGFARPSIEASIDQSRREKRVASAIDELPREQRKALQLRYSSELKWAEVGKQLGDVSAPRACQIRLDAIKNLRRKLRAA